jgi:hypothetical protein
MVTVTEVYQDGDCPCISVWTICGTVETSWCVHDDDTIESIYAYHGGIETETAREATAEESALILDAVRKYRAGEWKISSRRN